MPQPFVAIEDRAEVRWLTLSNPGKRNAVPVTGWVELAEAFRDFDASPQRAMVIRGAGDDFCAGADLDPERFLAGMTGTAGTADAMRAPGDAATALHRVSKPTIAAVDGVAVGAGMNLAIGCDLAIATERARFSEIFVRRGLTMDFGGSWLLPRLVGLARARDLALTGRIVPAAEALEMGLIGAVVAPDALESVVTERAEALAAGAPLAQRFVKVALDRSSTLSFEQVIALESQAQAVLLTSEDVVEGVRSFLEKRPPEFGGR
ncbi:MAG TPA: enoyl-CoA hydratase-related protein [Acidimicrobiia bacterium]